MKVADIYPKPYQQMVDECIIQDNGDASGIFMKSVLVERSNMVWRDGPNTGCELFSPGDKAYKSAGYFAAFEIVNL